MKSKKLNPAAIIALKEALASIYWYKKDLRSFLINTLDDTGILGTINWDDYKRNIADRLVETLVRNEDRYQYDLLKLFTSVAIMEDFTHLEYLDGGKEKAERAKKSVESGCTPYSIQG